MSGANRKTKTAKNNTKAVFAATLAFAASAVIIVFYIVTFGGRRAAPAFEQKADKLKDYVFSQNGITELFAGSDNYTVFISAGDRKSRAKVVHASGGTLEKAWDDAVSKAASAVGGNSREVVFVKADIVDSEIRINKEEFADYVKRAGADYFFRYGVAFDRAFETALLEQEINGNNLIDYDETNDLAMKKVGKYLSSQDRKSVSKAPAELILFTCRGYMHDAEEDSFYTLYHEPGADYGRRRISGSDVINTLDKDYVKGIISSGARYLAGLQKSDGVYVYGYHPVSGNVISSYNILRHAGTTWSMVNTYRITGDRSLVAPIEKGMEYLVSQVMYKDKDTAYIIEGKSNEIKLGANGISLLAILDYMEVFGNNKYDDIAVKIANGILELQNDETGGYVHVLYINEPGQEDYTLKEAFRTVFYDGEATLSLCKMYKRFGGEIYLNASKKAMDYFIAEDYTKYRDHWLSYAINELTQFAPEEKYHAFGLRNVQVNLERMRDKQITSSIDIELMMAAFVMYDRIKTSGAKVAYLDEFDEKDYIGTILNKIDYNMNAFAYPELAMYYFAPEQILGGFVVRNDNFRARIDDTQHHIGGYCLYVDNCDKIADYYNRLNS